MKILHISEIGNNLCDGMTTVIPSHVIEQSKIEDVSYLNLRNTRLEGFSKQFEYKHNVQSKDFKNFIGQFDIVIFHGLYIMEFIKISRILDSLDIPYVIVPHGSMTKMSQKKKRIKKIIANILFFNRFISHAAAVQFLSSGEANANAFKIKKSFIGTNGINTSTQVIQPNSRISNISFIGRIDVFHKGLDFLIEAVSRNRKLIEEKGIKVSIYGNDIKGRGAQVRKLIEDYNVSSLVTLNKEVFGDAKKNILMNTDVFVLTSRFEGMPMGVLEALSYGIPCMVTEGTNLKGFIDEYNAGWSSASNVDSVSLMLQDALKDDESLSLKSRNALKLIDSVFSWHIVSTNTIINYRSLLKHV